MTDCPDYSVEVEAIMSLAGENDSLKNLLYGFGRMAFHDGYIACQTDTNERMGIEDET